MSILPIQSPPTNQLSLMGNEERTFCPNIKKVQECFLEVQEVLRTRPCIATLSCLAGMSLGACFWVITYPKDSIDDAAFASVSGGMVALALAGSCFAQRDDTETLERLDEE